MRCIVKLKIILDVLLSRTFEYLNREQLVQVVSLRTLGVYSKIECAVECLNDPVCTAQQYEAGTLLCELYKAANVPGTSAMTTLCRYTIMTIIINK